MAFVMIEEEKLYRQISRVLVRIETITEEQELAMDVRARMFLEHPMANWKLRRAHVSYDRL